MSSGRLSTSAICANKKILLPVWQQGLFSGAWNHLDIISNPRFNPTFPYKNLRNQKHRRRRSLHPSTFPFSTRRQALRATCRTCQLTVIGEAMRRGFWMESRGLVRREGASAGLGDQYYGQTNLPHRFQSISYSWLSERFTRDSLSSDISQAPL